MQEHLAKRWKTDPLKPGLAAPLRPKTGTFRKMKPLAGLGVICLCAICCLFGCHSNVEGRADKNLIAISKEFFRLKNERRLVGLGKDSKGGNVSIIQVDDFVRREARFVMLKAVFAQCKPAHLTDAEIDNRKFTHLFCLDLGYPRLVGNYREADGRAIALPVPEEQ